MFVNSLASVVGRKEMNHHLQNKKQRQQTNKNNDSCCVDDEKNKNSTSNKSLDVGSTSTIHFAGKNTSVFDEEQHQKTIWLKTPNVKKLTTKILDVKKSATPKVKKSAPPDVTTSATPKVKKSATPKVKKSATPKVKKSATPKVTKSYTPEVIKSATSEVKTSVTSDLKHSTTLDVENSATPEITKITPAEQTTAKKRRLTHCKSKSLDYGHIWQTAGITITSCKIDDSSEVSSSNELQNAEEEILTSSRNSATEEVFARKATLPRPMTLGKFLEVRRNSWRDIEDHRFMFLQTDSWSHAPRNRSRSIVHQSETLDSNDAWKKQRKISSPEMLSRQKILAYHRKSLGSIDHLKLLRSNISARSKLLDPSMCTAGNNSKSTQELDRKSNSGGKNVSPGPPARHRALSSLFRKISSSTKQLHRRSLNLSAAEKSPDIDECNHRNSTVSNSSPSSSKCSDRELIIVERDRAIEEWTESAKKCEELIDELDQTLTELITVKGERDDKQRKLERLMDYYEDDLDDRDNEIEILQTQLIEISQKLVVARAERTEAYDQRDELLQQAYQCTKEMEELNDKVDIGEQENKELRQKCNLLEEQVIALKTDRDSALQLWNSTVEERKQLHDQQMSLTQARDDSLRQTFSHHEEISLLKSERDQLRRELERVRKFIQNNSHLSLNNRGGGGGESDSGFVSSNVPSPSADVADFPEVGKGNTLSIPEISIDGDNEDDNNEDDTPACVEESEDIAICIDTFDSRIGLKLDNAFDIPRVIVSDVTSELAEKWNIKKHDRIIIVNGVSVQHSDKKVVDRLIKDTVGRTISLVLRRENSLSALHRNHTDVEITLGKQLQDTGLYYSLKVQAIDKEYCAEGVQNVQVGDTITKINSQDINSMIEMLVKKLAKKSSNRFTLRVRRNEGHGEDSEQFKFQPHRRSLSLPSTPRKKSQTVLSGDSARNVFSDISSLFSFTSISQNNNNNNNNNNKTSNNFDDTLIASKNYTSNNITSSKSPTRQHRAPKLSKQNKPTLNIPSISVNKPVDDGNKLYSPVRSDSFESFTQILMDHYSNSEEKVPRSTSDVIITPPKRNSLYRPSPRLRGIDGLAERRTPKARSLYLEVLNRRSFTIPEPGGTLNRRSFEPVDVLNRRSFTPDPDFLNRPSYTILDAEKLDPRRSAHEVVKSLSLRSIAGYATLPRKYKRNKTREKQTSIRTVRINKNENDSLGFHICGGNKVGIFVNEVFKGSPAHVAGLKVGDKLLHLNSIDLTRATLDFATRVVLSNRKRLKIRIQVEEHPEYPDILDTPILESLYVRCLHSYNAVNLNEMSFKTGDILHITDTRYNFDAISLTWTWYGIKKVSALKHCEGEIPAIETFADNEVSDPSASGENNSNMTTPFRKISKSAQDIKKWFSKKPSIRRKKTNTTPRTERRSSSFNENSKRSSFYEILLEE